MKVIEVKGARKEFGKNIIIDGVNLIIEEGDIYGIIGPSGSGKSTLLSLLVGFMEPDEGTVKYYSRVTGKAFPLHSHLSFLRKQIGYTPQHLSFYPKLTVKENLLHFGRLYGIKEKILKDNAKNLLKFTGLWDFRDRVAEDLSGGMQKRLDISCSLVHKPKVLVLDEPTVDLDPLLRKDLMHLIKEVNRQGVTIIVASHDLETVELLCNKIAVIHHKHVYAFGSVEELTHQFGHKHGVLKIHTGRYHDQLLGFSSKLAVHAVIDHKTHLTLETGDLNSTMNALMRVSSEQNLPFTHIELSAPTLRSVFETITKH